MYLFIFVFWLTSSAKDKNAYLVGLSKIKSQSSMCLHFPLRICFDYLLNIAGRVNDNGDDSWTGKLIDDVVVTCDLSIVRCVVGDETSTKTAIDPLAFVANTVFIPSIFFVQGYSS